MKKYIFIFLLINCFFNTNIYSQNLNENNILTVQSIIADKGIDESELLSKLKSRGLDIENMTELQIMDNRTLIEEIINELEEANNNSDDNTSDENTIFEENLIIPNIDPTPVISESDGFSESEELEIENQDIVSAKIYGHNIFDGNALKEYSSSQDLSPPDSYILAPGDKINVLIFGKSQGDLYFEINKSGYIKPTKMPRILLSGLTLKQAKEMLISRFSNYYVFNNDQFAVTLNTSRTISVNVFGEVENMGSYTISALNTVLNAVTIAGGPTDFGSVRNIQIIRAGEKRVLDLYNFISNPNLQFDFFLQNNDIIYIPPVKKLVTIEGAVNRPMTYELKENEGINELLDFAGGLMVNAYSGLIQVQSTNNNELVLDDYSLDEIISNKISLVLKNADNILVKSIEDTLKGIVSISGAVFYDGDYSLKSTKTISALLKKANVREEAKTDKIFIIRKNIDGSEKILSVNYDKIINQNAEDVTLQEKDEIIIYDKSQFADQFYLTIAGEVRSPFSRFLDFENKISIDEALVFAGGLKINAADFGYVYRTDPFNSKVTKYIPINFKTQLNFNLMPGDQLIVLDKNNYDFDSTISIIGELNNQLTLRYDTSLSLKDLLILAGGTKISSSLENVDVFRTTLEDDLTPTKKLIKLKLDNEYNVLNNSSFSLQPYDIVVVRKIPDFYLNESIFITGEVKKAGAHMPRLNVYRFSDLIMDAEGFTSRAQISNISLIRYAENEGLIMFNPEKALKNPGSSFDPVLYDGDLLNVPKTNSFVIINTSATNYIDKNTQIKVILSPNRSANWYINNYVGGFASDADKKSVFTTSVNGKITKSNKFLFFRRTPKVNDGDIINVLIKDENIKDDKMKNPIDWDKLSTKLISFGTLIALFEQFNN